nr:MAG TPA: hypothetical protein [Caudoviricetes sp.]
MCFLNTLQRYTVLFNIPNNLGKKFRVKFTW